MTSETLELRVGAGAVGRALRSPSVAELARDSAASSRPAAIEAHRSKRKMLRCALTAWIRSVELTCPFGWIRSRCGRLAGLVFAGLWRRGPSNAPATALTSCGASAVHRARHRPRHPPPRSTPVDLAGTAAGNADRARGCHRSGRWPHAHEEDPRPRRATPADHGHEQEELQAERQLDTARRERPGRG